MKGKKKVVSVTCHSRNGMGEMSRWSGGRRRSESGFVVLVSRSLRRIFQYQKRRVDTSERSLSFGSLQSDVEKMVWLETTRKVYFVRYNGHEWTWIAAHHTRYCNAGDVCCRTATSSTWCAFNSLKAQSQTFPEFTVLLKERSERAVRKLPWDSVPGWTKNLKKNRL